MTGLPSAGPRGDEFQPEEIFAALAQAAVDYVTVGGFALIAHGVVRATLDVDIIPDGSPENLVRLADAIARIDGVPHGEPDTEVNVELLARDANMRFDTRVGQLDILGSASYRRMYADLRARSVSETVDGVPLIVVSRNDLVRLKAASDRDRDLLDIGDLLAVEESG